MDTKGVRRQRGFVLVTLIFLILIGVLLISAMAFLYNTTDSQQILQNGGAQAFIAAESGDQYGVYWLETNYVKNPLTKAALVTPPTAFPPDCAAAVTIPKPRRKNGVYTYLVQSTVVPACAASGAQRTVVRTVTAIPPGSSTKVCKRQGKKKKKKCTKVKNKHKTILYTTTGWSEQ
jgi:Tfp pilus assembly protein PilX